MQSIGFVGLGNMGGNMAARYLAAGYTVYGEARNRTRAQWLIEQGLRWVDTPRQVAEISDIVLTSLPDDDVLEAVGLGPDGVLAGLSSGKVWVDLSTVSPRASRELASRARAQGAELLDAPVSGSVPQVKAGTLTIMVGGSEQAYAGVEPVLRVLGSARRIGDSGQGLVLKLAINISLGVQMLAFSEGLLLAESEGIERHVAAEVMASSPIGSPMLKARVPLVLEPGDESWFDIGLMHKDIRLALEAGEAGEVPLLSARAAEEVLTLAADLGYERRDIASLPQVLAQLVHSADRAAA